MERFKRIFYSILRRSGVFLVFLAATMLSVGAASNHLTDGEKSKLIDQWAKQNHYETYTVSFQGSRTWLISEQKDSSYPIIPKRVAQEVHFSDDAITSVDAFNTENVINFANNLETFKILFDNALGLPDVASLQSSSVGEKQTESDPVSALKTNLQLDSACKIEGGAKYADLENVSIKDKPGDVEVYVISFADSSKVKVTVLHQFLIHDWTDENGANNRSAEDITAQFARGVAHKSGQYVYPILSTKLQNEMIDYQKHGGEEWYWKLGGSSPSYRDFVVLPTDKENTCIVVFQKYGGGLDDYRAAYTVETGKQNNRTVITDVQEMTPPNYTHSQLFQLYYNTGLALPTAEAHDLDSYYNAGTYRDLLQPETAAPILFYYCDNDGLTSYSYTVDTVSENAVPDKTGSITCTIHLKFADNSAPVAIKMKKTGDFWLPVDIANNTQNINEVFLTDIPVDAYYTDAVQWAVGQGVITDTSATTFSPNMPCTNGQILTFLWRFDGSPEPAITDLKNKNDYYPIALWAAEKGLVSDSEFDVGAFCTRAMTMTYLWKMAGSPTVSVSPGFTDVPTNASYAQAVAWAIKNDITTGTSATAFHPDAVCNRAQAITFIYRSWSLHI